LSGPPHAPGLVVLDHAGKYAGLVTVDDFMTKLARLYRDACDKPGKKQWFDTFSNQCEIMGFQKVTEIMSGKRLSVPGADSFEKSCELILSKNVNMLVVVDDNAKPVGIITRRKVLEEVASRMFK
jgi:CBS domain-containing protein